MPHCILTLERLHDDTIGGTIRCGEHIVDVLNWRRTETGAEFDCDVWLTEFVERLAGRVRA